MPKYYNITLLQGTIITLQSSTLRYLHMCTNKGCSLGPDMLP